MLGPPSSSMLVAANLAQWAPPAVLEGVSPCLQEKGNNNAQWWQQQLLGRLGSTGGSWMHVGLRQLSGMLIMVFALTSLQVGCRAQHRPSKGLGAAELLHAAVLAAHMGFVPGTVVSVEGQSDLLLEAAQLLLLLIAVFALTCMGTARQQQHLMADLLPTCSSPCQFVTFGGTNL